MASSQDSPEAGVELSLRGDLCAYAEVWKGAKPCVSWMMPATDPMAATMLISQQKALRVCSAIQ